MAEARGSSSVHLAPALAAAVLLPGAMPARDVTLAARQRKRRQALDGDREEERARNRSRAQWPRTESQWKGEKGG
eukprot:3539300-Rhodomonas_salina.1